MIATLLVLVLGGIAFYMISRNQPKDSSKFYYTEEEDTEVVDLPDAKPHSYYSDCEYQEWINNIYEESAKERGLTVDEYKEIVSSENLRFKEENK